jgi:hypothetical protein
MRFPSDGEGRGNLRPVEPRSIMEQQRSPWFSQGGRGQAPESRRGTNTFHPRKGKPGRKTGAQSYGPSVPTPRIRLMVAKLPKGWLGEEPVRPRALFEAPADPGTRLTGSGASDSDVISTRLGNLSTGFVNHVGQLQSVC